MVNSIDPIRFRRALERMTSVARLSLSTPTPSKIRRRSFAIPLVISGLLLTFTANLQAMPQGSLQTEPSDSNTSVSELIEDLGAPEFCIRQTAEQELLKLGEQAVEPLREACFAKDHETRLRARRLLHRLLDTELQRKLREFVKGENGEAELPGWNQFSEIVKDEENTRELFGALYERFPELFTQLENGDQKASRLQYQKAYSACRRVYFRSIASFAILFADTITFDVASETGGSQNPSVHVWKEVKELEQTANRIVNPYVVSFVESSQFESEFKKIIARWVNELPDHNDTIRAYKIRLIRDYKLADLLPELIEFSYKAELPIHLKSMAIAAIGQVGSKNDVKQIQPLLDNRQVVGHFKESLERDAIVRQVRVCDIALAVSVWLSEQALDVYGFQSLANKPPTISQSGFREEKDRRKAIADWQNYFQKHSQNAD